jgi:hypothetical protein
MKKALLILLVLSIVGAAAFADVKFGAFAAIGARADVVTHNGATTDRLYAWEWFQGTGIIGLATASFVGADPNMGYDTRFIVVNGNPNLASVDYANVWMKVANGMVTLNLGLFQAAEDFETAENAWGQNAWNEGSSPAFTAYATPLEGLTVGYQLPLTIVPSGIGSQTIADTFYNSKIGVRYTMKDVFGITGAYLMQKADKTSAAYLGVNVNAIPNAGIWFEMLAINIGSSLPSVASPVTGYVPVGFGGTNAGGETDLYAEANYPVWNGLKVGLEVEYNIVASTQTNGWVVEPYVTYPIMDKLNLMLALDIGTAAAAGANVWSWYGLQAGGPATAADNGIAWDVFLRASMMSPLGELRVQAKYGNTDSTLSGNTATSYFQVFAGVKWGF